MPRQDWHHGDEFMTRDRERGYRDFDDRDYGNDRRALFGGDRGELSMRRGRMGGWGSGCSGNWRRWSVRWGISTLRIRRKRNRR